MDQLLTLILIGILFLALIAQGLYFRRQLKRLAQATRQAQKTSKKQARKTQRREQQQTKALHLLLETIVDSIRKRRGGFLSCTTPDRIGHLASEPDCWLKERILSGEEDGFYGLIESPETAVNPHLLTYWEPFFDLVIPRSVWGKLLRAFPSLEPLLEERFDYAFGIDETATLYDIYTRWGDREPLLELREEDQGFLENILDGWGLKRGEWFVCLHNRESGYSPSDDQLNDYRNAPIESFIPAIKYITSQGGWVIRMGDSSMTPLPEMDRVVDYALSDSKSDRLDVALCASARFFLGSSSGLFNVSAIFGVPVASVNLTPFSTFQFTPRDLGIPKLCYSRSEQRLLTFPEIVDPSSSLANFRNGEQYEEVGVDPQSNSPEEIVEVTREILEQVSGKVTYTAEDEELQQAFRDLFRPGHYGYGSSARTGREFLRRHKDLLFPDKAN